MKYLVYTSVFGGYDRVFPPISAEPDITYVIVTDDPALFVKGWQTHVVDIGGFASASLANRYYKMLIHRALPGYGASLYVDGNIRLKGKMSHLFAQLESANTDLLLFPHPSRNSVAEEVECCIQRRFVRDAASARAELAAYTQDGFDDDQGLIEATILFKRHDRPVLDQAMQMWWDLYNQYKNRDQFSLSYVLWKMDISYSLHDFNFRNPNPWFGLYPHRGDPEVNTVYADLYARSYDSVLHRGVLGLWHSSWTMRRLLRRIRGA